MQHRVALLAGVCLVVPACSHSSGGGSASTAAGTTTPATVTPTPIPGTTVAMDYSSSGGFYAAPFPDESRRGANGTIDLDLFPGRTAYFVNALATTVDTDGFGLSSGAFFSLTAPVNSTALPSLAATVLPGANVFLMGVDAGAPDYQKRYPVTVAFRADGGPFGAANMLSLVPLQGVPLREGTLYAAVVLRSLGDATGAPLGVPLAMAQLAAGVPPAGMSPSAFSAHQSALAALAQAGVASSDLAGIATFRTGHPTAQFTRFWKAVIAQPLPQLVSPLTLTDTFADYYVLQSTINMPVFQNGAPPFFLGGAWQVDTTGAPVQQGTQAATIYVTVPRQPMPAAGFPAAVLIITGMGSNRAIVDRVTAPNGPPGSGPALEFAQAGFLGVQVDGPMEGIRNTTGISNEDLRIVNFLNPIALRDNIRQSALELALLAEVLPTLSIDPAQCPGVTTPQGGPIVIDPATMAIMGHSLGATIEPLVLATTPRYRAGVLSGAGSWIENVLWKEMPFPILPFGEQLLGYTASGRVLEQCDPIMSLLQWALEPADPLAYTRYVTTEPQIGAPRHILMIQGITDHYILPPIADATSLSLGLDLAGTPLDVGMPAQPQFQPPFLDVASFVGGQAIGLPASANRVGPGGVPYTAVLTQQPQDGIEDGHEVAFQVAAAKTQWSTFLATLAQGVPSVP